MTAYPTKLSRLSDREIVIDWSDQQKRRYTATELRSACPCATCREKQSHVDKQPPPLLPILSDAETRPLGIARMKPVGNYAYSIDFTDGHSTGIYPLELLKELGQQL